MVPEERGADGVAIKYVGGKVDCYYNILAPSE